MAESITDRIFASLQSVDADKLFVESPDAIEEREFTFLLKEDDWTFRDFMDRPSMKKLSPQQKNQIRNLWIEGGQPAINILPKGAKGGEGDVNRASYTHMFDVEEKDRMNIFEHELLGDFMAEIAHARQYTRRPAESKEDWIKRREKLWDLSRSDKETFGDDRYGEVVDAYSLYNVPSDSTVKRFPFLDYGPRYKIGRDDSGEEVVVDKKGNLYLDKEVPPYKYYNKDSTSYSRTDEWYEPAIKWTTFDPETRKGLGGQSLPLEFEAHNVIEDSLWDDWRERFSKRYSLQEP